VNTREKMALVTRLLASSELKRAGVGTNGILECKYLSENAHRTSALLEGNVLLKLRACQLRFARAASTTENASMKCV
jgi:hypothetical protein